MKISSGCPRRWPSERKIMSCVSSAATSAAQGVRRAGLRVLLRLLLYNSPLDDVARVGCFRQ